MAEQRNHSRSRSPRGHGEGGWDTWNEELWKFFTEEVGVEAQDAIVEETIQILEGEGEISHTWELLAAP